MPVIETALIGAGVELLYKLCIEICTWLQAAIAGARRNIAACQRLHDRVHALRDILIEKALAIGQVWVKYVASTLQDIQTSAARYSAKCFVVQMWQHKSYLMQMDEFHKSVNRLFEDLERLPKAAAGEQ